MHKRWRISLGIVLMVLVLLVSMTGCAEKKADPAQTTETVQESMTTAATEPADTEVPETSEEQPEETTVQVTETIEETTHANAPKPTEPRKPDKGTSQTATVPTSDGSQSGQDEHKTDPVPEGQQLPVEPGDVEVNKQEELTCYLSISCKTILDNMGDLKDGKEVLVPADGMLLNRTAVKFHAGESVFDILKQVTMDKRIHMESNFVPMYNSAYIKGIGNLYEFDCGSGSGWMYCVNGWFPNYGVSRYVPQNGDEIQFIYTCDLGRDIGGHGSGQN